MKRTNIYLTGEQKDAIAAAAKRRGCSSSALIRRAIDDYLSLYDRHGVRVLGWRIHRQRMRRRQEAPE